MVLKRIAQTIKYIFFFIFFSCARLNLNCEALSVPLLPFHRLRHNFFRSFFRHDEEIACVMTNERRRICAGEGWDTNTQTLWNRRATKLWKRCFLISFYLFYVSRRLPSNIIWSNKQIFRAARCRLFDSIKVFSSVICQPAHAHQRWSDIAHTLSADP